MHGMQPTNARMNPRMPPVSPHGFEKHREPENRRRHRIRVLLGIHLNLNAGRSAKPSM
jgi:hypothetical protein